MTLVNDDNECLEITERFAITKQACSLLNFKIMSNVSVNFSLDNTSEVRKTLGYTDANQIDSPALSQIPFNLSNDGNIESRGGVVIQRVAKKLDCYYVSGNANWFNDFQFDIQGLNLNDYVVAWTYTQMNARKSSTSGIIFPLIDWAYKGQKFPAVFMADPMYLQVAVDGTTRYSDSFSDFYPCFYLHTLVEEVFKYTGYKLAGKILTEWLYLTAVITPSSGAMIIPDIFIKQRETLANLTTAQNISDPFSVKISFTKVYTGTNNPYSDTLFRWTADGTYQVSITVKLTIDVSQSYTLRIMKNGVSVSATIFVGVALNLTFSTSAVSGDYFEVWNETTTLLGTVPYIVAAGSSVLYTISPQVTPSFSITPNAIIPSMQAVDLIKFLAIRFGCICTFNPYSKTITLNQFQKFKLEDAADWSDYIVDHEEWWQNGYKNNFLRLPQPTEFAAYTAQEGYGGTKLETGFNINQDRELYTDPFAGALDQINTNGHGLLQPVIQAVENTDADAFTVSSVTNSGGYVAFNVVGFKLLQNNTIIRCNCPAYVGYHIVTGSTATLVTTITPYTQNSTGSIFTQTSSFADIGPRLLTCIPDYTISKIGPLSTIDVYSGGAGHVSHSTWPMAYFSKPTTGRGIDQYNVCLSYGAIDISGFKDQPIDDNLYSKVQTMLNNTPIRVHMILPRGVFKNYEFGSFIQIKFADLIGYFFPDSIVNYVDEHTPVEVNVYML